MLFRNRIELNRQSQFHECIDFPFHFKEVEFKKRSGNKRDTGHASLRGTASMKSQRMGSRLYTLSLFQNSPCPPQTPDKLKGLKIRGD